MNKFKPTKPTVKRTFLDAILYPFRKDAEQLKTTLTSQGVNEPVSVLYRYPAPGRVECTVRVGDFFNDSHLWFVAEVM